MRYYIDTNTLIFYMQDALDDNTFNLIDNYENVIYVSSTVLTELIYLIQYNRIKLKQHIEPANASYFIENTLGFKIKYVDKYHMATFANLPVYSEHADHNDRLIIAQAIAEKIPIISTDAKFPWYEKNGLLLIRAKH